jgi:hypothetical protein
MDLGSVHFRNSSLVGSAMAKGLHSVGVKEIKVLIFILIPKNLY